MLPKLIDMRRTDDEKQKSAALFPVGSQPEYPYGLSLCLTHNELAKLGLESNCEVGEMIHLFALAKVTSISKQDTGNGEECRIELQVTHLGTESEDEEDEEFEKEQPLAKHGYYKAG